MKQNKDINHRKIVRSQNGKISLSRSLVVCPNCQQYSSTVQALRQEVFHLHQVLAEERKKSQQME